MIETALGYQIATLSLILFVALGAFDGIYFHMIKYQLYKHPPARFEHLLHTFRGFLFLPIALLFFVWNSAGSLLWIGIFLLLIDFIAEIVDIMIEKEARKSLGGISSVESVIHITATGFRMAAIAIILSLKPLEAYKLQYITNDLPPLPNYLQGVGELFIIGLSIALIVQVVHNIISTVIGRMHLPCCGCQTLEQMT